MNNKEKLYELWGYIFFFWSGYVYGKESFLIFGLIAWITILIFWIALEELPEFLKGGR